MEKAKKKTHILSFQNFKIGLLVSVLVQPFEVIRTSSIMKIKNMNNGFSGTLGVIKEILKREGYRGLFRGSILSMGKSTISAGLFFTGLENTHLITKEFRTNRYILDNAIDFFNACFTKAFCTLVVNPIVVIKTRFEIVGNNEYTNIRHAIRSIYNKEGLAGFSKGIMTTLLRDVPYSGVQYSSYKFCLNFYQNYIDPTQNPRDSSILISLIGALSAIYAVMLTYPFDNLRVRL
jgi:solute carrier family 25 protein 38